MKKLLNLGKPLNKVEQKQIQGGVDKCCLRPPPNGIESEGSWCNSRAACCRSSCACNPCGVN